MSCHEFSVMANSVPEEADIFAPIDVPNTSKTGLEIKDNILEVVLIMKKQMETLSSRFDLLLGDDLHSKVKMKGNINTDSAQPAVGLLNHEMEPNNTQFSVHEVLGSENGHDCFNDLMHVGNETNGTELSVHATRKHFSLEEGEQNCFPKKDYNVDMVKKRTVGNFRSNEVAGNNYHTGNEQQVGAPISSNEVNFLNWCTEDINFGADVYTDRGPNSNIPGFRGGFLTDYEIRDLLIELKNCIINCKCLQYSNAYLKENLKHNRVPKGLRLYKWPNGFIIGSQKHIRLEQILTQAGLDIMSLIIGQNNRVTDSMLANIARIEEQLRIKHCLTTRPVLQKVW